MEEDGSTPVTLDKGGRDTASGRTPEVLQQIATANAQPYVAPEEPEFSSTNPEDVKDNIEKVPELSKVAEPAFEGADAIQNDDTGQAIGRLKKIADTGMTVHNLLDLSHGMWNNLMRGLYEFGPTSMLFTKGAEDARVIAKIRMQKTVRLLVFATEYPGRFTNEVRNWLISQFNTLASGTFRNPDASQAAVQAIAFDLTEQAVMHMGVVHQANKGGDPNLAPDAGPLSAQRVKNIKQMLRILGAPIPITIKGYENGELNPEQSTFVDQRIADFKKVGLLMPGDKVSIGLRVYSVDGDK